MTDLKSLRDEAASDRYSGAIRDLAIALADAEIAREAVEPQSYIKALTAERDEARANLAATERTRDVALDANCALTASLASLSAELAAEKARAGRIGVNGDYAQIKREESNQLLRSARQALEPYRCDTFGMETPASERLDRLCSKIDVLLAEPSFPDASRRAAVKGENIHRGGGDAVHCASEGSRGIDTAAAPDAAAPSSPAAADDFERRVGGVQDWMAHQEGWRTTAARIVRAEDRVETLTKALELVVLYGHCGSCVAEARAALSAPPEPGK